MIEYVCNRLVGILLSLLLHIIIIILLSMETWLTLLQEAGRVFLREDTDRLKM